MNTLNNSLNRLQTLKSQGPFKCYCGKHLDDNELKPYCKFEEAWLKEQTTTKHQLICFECNDHYEWSLQRAYKNRNKVN
jgi:hypothetical protein